MTNRRGPATLAQEKPWEPVLLRLPDGLDRARRAWVPVALRRRELRTMTLLLAFLALQFLLPSRLVIAGLGAVGRPSVAVGILLGFLWCVSAIRPHQLPAARQPVRWIVGAYFATQLFGYGVGYDRLLPAIEASGADRKLILITSMVGLSLAVADGVSRRRHLDRLLRALVGFAAAMAAVGILQFLGLDLVQYIRVPGLHEHSELIGVGARGHGAFPRVPGTANHYIEFGVVLGLLLPLALHYALFSPPGPTRWWRWVAVGLIATGIPLSISRSAVLTVVLSMSLLALVWPWRQRYNAAVIAVIATAVFHVVNRGVLGTIKGLFINVDDDPSVQNRIARTEYVIDLWSQRPWIGRGLGTVLPDRYILLDNQLYMTLLAGGIFGVLGLVTLFVSPYLMGRSIRLRGSDQETRHLGQALAVVLPAGFMASGTFDSFSFATFVGVTFMVVGAMGALWRLEGMHPSRPMQVAGPDDRFVTTPLMADIRNRLHAGALALRRHDGVVLDSRGRRVAPSPGVPRPATRDEAAVLRDRAVGERPQAPQRSGHDR